MALAIQPIGVSVHAQPAPQPQTPPPSQEPPNPTTQQPSAGPQPPVAPPARRARPAASSDAFTVGDIRVEGLQRISEGTVFNYLPVNIGDHLDDQRIGEALRALYATGFFRDVELRRDGNTLLVVVVERPSIAKFEVKGNKDIKTEDLTKSLRNVGLAQGKTFDRSVLDEVKQYLTDQYFSRGKYAVRVDTKVTDLPGNKVDVVVDIKEGKRAKIEMINLVGDTKFKENEVLQTFELKTPNWLSWYKQDDRYSRESLTGDLEKLRSYYMDRGYANFQIESTQVTIAPEKDDMYITINVNEGDVFKVSDIKLAGTMVVPEEQLKRLLLIHPGDIFSRKLVTSSQELMSYRLGADGYAFSKIDPVPTPDNDKKTVSLTFFIEPGNRVYVRHINFNNTTAINDETLRREMRQLEGGWLSNSAIERSKERIQRLPYVEKVEFETKPVPGSADLVDVDYNIKEGLPGQFGGGIGYSEAQKFSINGNFVHSNFMGTRRSHRARGQRRQVPQDAIPSRTPTRTRPSTGCRAPPRSRFRDITQFVAASSKFSTKQLTLAESFSYPITEYQYLSGGRVRQQERTGGLAGLQLAAGHRLGAAQRQHLHALSGRYQRRRHHQFARQPLYGLRHAISIRTRSPAAGISIPATARCSPTAACIWQFPGAWRCRSATCATTPPTSSSCSTSRSGASGCCHTTRSVDYASALGKTTVPAAVFELFRGRSGQRPRLPREHAWGPGTISASAIRSAAISGSISRFELLFPVPDKWKSAARVSWFYDMGNVFYTGNKVQIPGRGRHNPGQLPLQLMIG